MMQRKERGSPARIERSVVVTLIDIPLGVVLARRHEPVEPEAVHEERLPITHDRRELYERTNGHVSKARAVAGQDGPTLIEVGAEADERQHEVEAQASLAAEQGLGKKVDHL